MDIFLLLYLSHKIYIKAQENALTPWLWVTRLVTLFITTELVIAMITINYFGVDYFTMDKILYTAVPSLLLASLSAYFVFQQLNREIAQIREKLEAVIEEEEIEKPNLDHFR